MAQVVVEQGEVDFDRIAAPAYRDELSVAIDVARAAGARILDFYHARTATEYEKGDGSPVTDADLAADLIIRDGILDAFPGDAMMTEEGADDPARLAQSRLWIVDPLDGTAQFINRTGEFDVMIALAVEGEPVVAVIYQPPTGLLTFATAGGGAWRQEEGGEPERIVMRQAGHLPVIAASIYYGAVQLPNTLARIAGAVGAPPPVVLTVGYQPRRVIEPTWVSDAFVGLWQPDGTKFAREWDLAAPQLVTAEAGGLLTDAYGAPYRYNQPDSQITRGLVAANDPALHAGLIAAIARELPLEDKD